MNKVQMIAKNLKGTIVKNSPSIFTGLAVTGLITTTVMACKATPKAISLIDEARENKLESTDKDLTPVEIVEAAWKCYLPSVLMGGTTIACIICANSINLRRNAALASVCSITETTLKEYQSKVVEELGDKKEQKIRESVSADKLKASVFREDDVIITGNGNTLCFESWTGNYFRSDIDKIKQAFNRLGRDMLGDSFISLNDMYYELNLPNTKLGDLVGWHVDYGVIEPIFTSQLNDRGEPCLVLDYNLEPRYGVES